VSIKTLPSIEKLRELTLDWQWEYFPAEEIDNLIDDIESEIAQQYVCKCWVEHCFVWGDETEIDTSEVLGKHYKGIMPDSNCPLFEAEDEH